MWHYMYMLQTKAIHLFPGEHGEILRRPEVGGEKWRAGAQAAISLKRVKIDEKLLWRAYRNSPALFRTVPSPTLYGLPFSKIGSSQPHPKLRSLFSQERVKLRF